MRMASKWIVMLSGTTTFFTLSNFIRSRKDPAESIERKETLTKQPISLVIGTGIIGLTSAYYLARTGHQVICIDKREDVALETSYKNGSLICPSLLTPWANADVPKKFIRSFFQRSDSSPSTKIWPSTWFSMKFYRWMYEYLSNCTSKAQIRNAERLLNLSIFSRRCLDEIINEVTNHKIEMNNNEQRILLDFQTSIEFSRSSVGSLQLAVNKEIYEQLKEESEHIADIQYLSDSDQVVAQEPILNVVKDRLYAGVFSSMDTNGNIHEFCCEMKKYLIEKYNVQFLFGQTVKKFLVDQINDDHNNDRRRRIIAIQTENGQTISHFDHVIVSNGNDIMPLMKKLNLYIPIYPVKGYVVEIKVPSTIPLPKVNLVDDVNKLYISALKPNAEFGLVRVSGLAEFAGWKDIGILSEPDRAEYLYEQTIRWLPHLASYEKSFHSCSRPVSPDDVPLIGRCADFDNLYVNCGQGSKGWTLAFGSAALLARIINRTSKSDETAEIDPNAYSPNRFR